LKKEEYCKNLNNYGMKYFFSALVILLIILIISPLALNKPSGFFDNVSKIFKIGSLVEENTLLKSENQGLRNEINRITAKTDNLEGNYILAKVFSLYPFNTKSRLYINIGSDLGANKNEAVLIDGGVIVGKISNVNQKTSEVITLFDPSFSLPVRIGSQEIDGLLEGGLSPKISFVDKTKSINPGDEIFSSSKDFSYGLFVGTIGSVGESSSGAFLEATVDLPYSLTNLRNIWVVNSIDQDGQ
jgi:rod shape-determining protein MreC